jgi:hypothetical protein
MTDQVDTALKFIECINRGDVDGLAELMTAEHVFIDLSGEKHVGREAMKAGWESYTTMCPDYMIHISEIHQRGARVMLVGRTTGSHLKQPRLVEFESGTLIWIAEIEGDRLSLWQLTDDTPESRRMLDIPLLKR